MPKPFQQFLSQRSYRELVFLSSATFLFGIIYGLFSLYLPIFAENMFGNLALVGILIAIPEITGVLFDLPLGAFVDRFGRRRATLLGAACLIIVAILFESWRSIIGFALLLGIYGIILELVIIPTSAELMAVSPRRRSGKFFGIYEALHNFGYSIGPFIGGFLLSLLPPPIFWVLAGLSLFLFLFLLFFMRRDRLYPESFVHAVESVAKKDHIVVGSIKEFKEIGWFGWLLLLFWFTFALRWGAIAILEPLYTIELNINPIFIGIIYAAQTLPFAFFSMWAGNLFDRKGPKQIIIGGLFLMGVATFLFGTVSNPYILFFLAFLAATGDAILVPTALASFDTLSQRHFKGKIAGVVTLVESLGYLLGPLIAGPLAYFFGFRSTFYLFGIFILFVMVMGLLVRFPMLEGKP